MSVCVSMCEGTHVCMYIGACICIDLSMSVLSVGICVHLYVIYICTYTHDHGCLHVDMQSSLSLSRCLWREIIPV